MKVYAEKSATLTTLASVLGGSLTLLLKDWVLTHFTSRVIQLLVLCAPFVAALIASYSLNLVLIYTSSPVELRDRMFERWRSCLQTGGSPDPVGQVQDLVDRAAVL